MLIPQKYTKSKLGFYNSNEVLAVFELKAYGIMGNKVADIRNDFDEVKKINPKISCFYISLMDDFNYTYPVNEQTLGYPAYCLFKDIKQT